MPRPRLRRLHGVTLIIHGNAVVRPLGNLDFVITRSIAPDTHRSAERVGIYPYESSKRIPLKIGDFTEELVPILMGSMPEMIRKGAVLFAISSFFQRSIFKYGSRGYRYILIEAGELSAHLQLIGTSLKLGTCQIAGYYDDEVNTLLGLDGVNEAVMNLCIAGKIKEDVWLSPASQLGI